MPAELGRLTSADRIVGTRGTAASAVAAAVLATALFGTVGTARVLLPRARRRGVPTAAGQSAA